MDNVERAAPSLRGTYRDVLRDPRGSVLWDRGWRSNAIVGDCRRLLASFMRGTPGASGIAGLAVGAGLAAWDLGGPPPPTPGATALVDANPHVVPVADLQIDFLQSGVVSGTPTNRIQIEAVLGPGVPPWPDADHTTGNLREFGLVATLDGGNVLVNYVTHQLIAKDPASTLERTIWIVF